MTVTDLIEKLQKFPQDLEVHVMADLESDLVDIGSLHLITRPFTEEPFVVIEVQHPRKAIENRSGELEASEVAEAAAPENGDSPPTPKQ